MTIQRKSPKKVDVKNGDGAPEVMWMWCGNSFLQKDQICAFSFSKHLIGEVLSRKTYLIFGDVKQHSSSLLLHKN